MILFYLFVYFCVAVGVCLRILSRYLSIRRQFINSHISIFCRKRLHPFTGKFSKIFFLRWDESEVERGEKGEKGKEGEREL